MLTFRRFSHVLIRNIDTMLDRQKVKEIFSNAGNVKSVLMEYNEETLSNSGFAVIKYDSINTVKKAVDMFNKKRIGSHYLSVEVLHNDDPNTNLNQTVFEPRTDYKNVKPFQRYQPSI